MNSLLLTVILFCVPIGSTIRFIWNAPTTNEDGTPLNNLRQYRMYEKLNDGPWKVRIGISNKVTSVQYRLLEEGTYRFYLTAINTERLESKPSNEVTIVSERPVPQPSATPR